jgi:DNA-binding phage protein
MALNLRKWDSVEYLKTEKDMALYLEACMEEAGDDAAFIISVQNARFCLTQQSSPFQIERRKQC